VAYNALVIDVLTLNAAASAVAPSSPMLLLKRLEVVAGIRAKGEQRSPSSAVSRCVENKPVLNGDNGRGWVLNSVCGLLYFGDRRVDLECGCQCRCPDVSDAVAGKAGS
jgi:hypothetical protein